MERVILLTTSLNLGTGGTASLIDHLSALRMSGKDVKVVEVSFRHLLKSFWLPGFFLKLARIASFRPLLNSFVKWYFDDVKLLIGSNLCHDYQEFLLSSFGTSYLNHPASVDLMKEWQTMSDREYINYTAKFAKVIFQSEIQCGDYERFTSNKNGIVLYPTVNEKNLETVLLREDRAFKEVYLKYSLNIIMIGTVIPRKGQLEFVELLRKTGMQNVCLHLVGSTPDGDYLEQLDSIERNFDMVIWGYSADYAFHLKYADIVVNWSKAEGVSRIIREALYMNKNIIGCNISGNIEALSNKGGLILKRDISAKNLHRILENYRSEFSSYDARKCYSKVFSSIQYSERVKELYV